MGFSGHLPWGSGLSEGQQGIPDLSRASHSQCQPGPDDLSQLGEGSDKDPLWGRM